MLEHFKTYLLYGSLFCSLEHSLKDDQDIIYGTPLKRSKKEVNIKACFSLKTIEDVATNLPKHQHIHLVINNDQVLTKLIKSDQTDALNVINKAFPNINVSEFYYEFINQGDSRFVSICRKKNIDYLVKAYQRKGIHVVLFSLGNTGLANVIPYIEGTQIFTSNANIAIRDKYITTINYSQPEKETHYNVNGLDVSHKYLLSFSGALSYIIGNHNSNSNYQDKIGSLFDNYRQVRFFGQFLKLGLIVILAMLLINFLYYNFYFNQINILNQTSQLNQTTKNNIVRLNESVNKAKKTAEDLLKSSASKSSFYMNALVHSLPNSILLSEVNYQPLMKNIKPDKPIELNQNIIIVSGESSNKSQYSQWITTLEGMDWIQNITIETYNDSRSAYSHFSIKISITYDTSI